MRYRRNIDCLTTNQLHDLREALAILYSLPEASPHSYLHVAGIHGEPAPHYCIHGVPGFLTWHRAYLLVLEEALQCINPAVTVPFWNWSSRPTTGVPAACRSETYVNRAGDTVENPLYRGPLPAGGPGTRTSRRPDIDTTSFADLATTAQTALANDEFSSFQYAMNNVHGGVHGRVGGNMSSVPYAGFDPIFFLHHANVDRLWAQWQATHPEPLPSDEAGLALDPFVRPCSTDLYTGADMQSTVALGYRYLHFCFFPIRPFVLKARIDLPPWVQEGFDLAKLRLGVPRMSARTMELRVFLNAPDADERTRTEGNPRFAGSFGLFGMAPGSSVPKHPSGGHHTMDADKAESFDLQLDISAALREALRHKKRTTLTLVAVDPKGKRVPPKHLDFDGMEVQIT